MRIKASLIIFLLAISLYSAPLSLSTPQTVAQENALFAPTGIAASKIDEIKLVADQLWWRHTERQHCSYFPGVMQPGGWKKVSYFPTYGLDEKALLWAKVLAWGRPVTDLYLAPGVLLIEGDVPEIDLEMPDGYVKIKRLRRKLAELHLTTHPEKAYTTMDGLPLSPTPTTVAATILPSTTVRFEVPGYAVHEEMVELRPGKVQRLKADLIELPADARRLYPTATVRSAQGVSSIEMVQQRIEALQKSKEAGRLNPFGEKLLSDYKERAQEMDNQLYAHFLPSSLLEYGKYDQSRELLPVSAVVDHDGFRFQFVGELLLPRDDYTRFLQSREERVDQETTMKLSSRTQKKTYPKRPGQGVRAGAVEITFRNHTIELERSGKVENYYHDIVGLRLLQGGATWAMRGTITFPSWFGRAAGWGIANEKLAVRSNDSLTAWETSPLVPAELLARPTLGDVEMVPPILPVTKAEKSFWKTSGRYLAYLSGIFLSGYALIEHFDAVEMRDDFAPQNAAEAVAGERAIRKKERHRNSALVGAGVMFGFGVVLKAF